MHIQIRNLVSLRPAFHLIVGTAACDARCAAVGAGGGTVTADL